ncbi:UPF0489 protein C5orf22 homolog [Uloborus diversus]|uniref:UPF0489 protein C5orf22 homolog n=1 Tax=Uloborus diversus TaxID=327109 RepID=UPI002409E69A|nr:UPF0489 protein C5orf22 homolog [Uloborus diversus]XP_054720429.1 UPF0489 protein C5orf22 homolog [Uloborus diversus]
MLRELYHYEHPEPVTNETLKEVTRKRQEQLSELESIFKSIKDNSIVSSSPRLEAARRLLATFPGGVPPDPGLLNDAGCTCDDCDLPHHVSTPDQVRHLVGETKEFLSNLPVPALVTISRSSRDDYCPPEDVNFIQELVLEMLKNLYGALDITIDYEEEAVEQGTSTST